jgi:toxin HigB-1
VNITFTDEKFGKIANDDRKRLKEFGKLRADKIKLRLGQLTFAETLEDVEICLETIMNLKITEKGNGLAI